VPDFQRLRHTNKMPFAYQVCAQLGKFPFPKQGKAVEQFLCGDETQNRVSQKLQLFIVPHGTIGRGVQGLEFPRLGAMGQSLLQKLKARKVIGQGRFQGRDVT